MEVVPETQEIGMTLEEAIERLRQPAFRTVLTFPSIEGMDDKFWTAIRTVVVHAIREREAVQGESELVSVCQSIYSDFHWALGAAIGEYVKRFGHRRDEVEMAQLIGMTSTEFRSCRDVDARFRDSRKQFGNLGWRHFHAAVGWDDAEACLTWADEVKATIAEMRAWRRAHHGEDLSVDEAMLDGAQ